MSIKFGGMFIEHMLECIEDFKDLISHEISQIVALDEDEEIMKQQ